MHNRFIFFFIILAGLLACNKSEKEFRNEEGRLVHQKFYENGKLKYEGTSSLDNDTIIDGYVKLFYENGKLKSEMSYKNDTLNGDLTVFYPNGKIMLKQPYNMGKRHGESIQYNENGEIEKTIWRDDVVLENWDYYANGNIKLYLFNSKDGRKTLRIDYDEEGNVKDFKGYGYWFLSSDSLTIGEKYENEITIANPPMFDRKFYIEPLNKSGKVTNIKEYIINDNKVKYDTVFIEVGEFIYKVKLVLTNQKTKEIIEKSWELKAIVK